MNLIDDAWIPCVRLDGELCLASLRDCFTDEGIADVAVRPHERVALMRLLLCLAYAAAGIPEEDGDWESLRESLPSLVPPYLDKWREAFELFHPDKPFLQVAGLREGSGVSRCGKLDFSRDNVLWDHAKHSGRSFPPEWLALNLLTFQMFSLSGIISTVRWGDTTTKSSSSDAPCSPGSMLHTFLRGKTLLDTIHANMLSEENLSGYTERGDNWQGRPLWEQFPRGLDDVPAVHNATETFLGRMVPLTRAILLSPDGVGMLLGDGLPFPSFNNAKRPFPPEVTATIREDKKKETRSVLGLQTDKAIWRQLPALTVKRHGNELGGCAALVHSSYYDNADLVVCALARKPGQKSVVDVVESVFNMPAAIFREEGHALYENQVAIAEKIAGTLGNAVKCYFDLMQGAEKKNKQEKAKPDTQWLRSLKARAASHYWTAVETGLSLLWHMLRVYGSEELPQAQDEWRAHLEASARAAYAAACDNDSERRMRAYVTARRILEATLRKYREDGATRETA